MQRQLADIVRQFEDAGARLHRLADALPPDRWSRRNDPRRLSVAECVAHLNLTSRAYLPLIRRGLDELQAAQIRFVRAADGRPVDRVRITSPFDARLRYSLYSAFVILPRHQRRHIVQAERVWPGGVR